MKKKKKKKRKEEGRSNEETVRISRSERSLVLVIASVAWLTSSNICMTELELDFYFATITQDVRIRAKDEKKREEERDKLEEGEEELGAMGKRWQLDKLFETLFDSRFAKVTRAVPDDPLLDDVRNTIHKCSIVW